MSMVEASALAGHAPAISGLAATFYTGLRRGTAGPFLIPPSPELNQCWEAAKKAPAHAATCAAMRASGSHHK
jgi:hypothetical protein